MLSSLRQRLAAVRRQGTGGLPPPPPQDVEAFLDVARRSFIGVQRAWDRGDLAALSALATEHLFQELRAQLAERGDVPNHTEVLRVEARLLAVERLRDAQIACVEFSGLIRERHDEPPMPFRELWMLARVHPAGDGRPVDYAGDGRPVDYAGDGRPVDHAGDGRSAEPAWRVACVQALC